jgi:fructose-bisphosphate aldolase class II
VGYTALVAGVRDAIRNEVERCVRLWGSAGRADEVLAAARPWCEVEHVILYNTATDAPLARNSSRCEVESMMAEGREVLGSIPGVRGVFTGRAVQPDGRYRYCWLVRFASPAVIDSYRVHPDHQDFADNLFRPIAPDRISIDFQGLDQPAASPGVETDL